MGYVFRLLDKCKKFLPRLIPVWVFVTIHNNFTKLSADARIGEKAR